MTVRAIQCTTNGPASLLGCARLLPRRLSPTIQLFATRLRVVGAAFSMMLVLPATVRSQRADSTSAHRAGGAPFFVPRDAGVLAAGLVASVVLTPFDRRIAHWTQSTGVQGAAGRRRFVSRVTRVNETTLTLGGIATYGIGRLTGSRATADIALHTTEAVVLTSVTSQLIRGPLGRSRPSVTRDSNQFDFHFMKGFTAFKYRAFPSLHAATAYAAGAALVSEVRERHPQALWYAAPLLFGAASLPGLSRMYLDQHWASDIVMGGVVGVLLGSKVVEYAHGHPGNRFDRALLQTGIAPGELTLSFQVVF